MHEVKILSLALLVLLCLMAPVVDAQPAPAPLSPPVRKLVAEGDAALLAGRPADALGRFEEAYRQSRSPELLRRLGQVAQAQDRTIQAVDLYRRYLQEPGAELNPAAQQELREFVLKPLDASDEVAVFGDDGALVLLDDRVVGSLPLLLPLLVSPGSHKLHLEKGKRRVEAQVKLLANRPMQVRFTLVPPVAVATPTAAAVFLADAGALPEGLVSRLLRAASQAAAEERLLLLPRDKLAAILSAAPELKACIDTLACQEKLAARAEAQYVVALKIEGQLSDEEPAGQRKKAKQEEGRGRWGFSLRLYDVLAGATAAEGQNGCEGCGVDRAGLVLAEVMGKVAQDGTTRPRGTLEVASTPPGAEVVVDGRQLGAAPARADAFAGPHEVVVAISGYSPYRTTATVTDGETTRLQAQLTRLAPPPSPVAAKPRAKQVPRPAVPIYKKAWFWGTLGGIALVGAGLATGLALGLNQGSSITAGKTYPNPFVVSF